MTTLGPTSAPIFSQTPHSTDASTLYSPDMAPCDFLLFPQIKNTFEGNDLMMWK
jgi:hypothetical protein